MEPGKLFIGGISWDTNEDRLREYFQTFGDVVEAMIMKDRTTGRARGFGFVIYADPAVAERVVKQKHMLDGRTVEAKKAVPRDDSSISYKSNSSIHGSPGTVRTKKIFVGGLPSSITESDFKRYFDQFGMITDVVVMYDHHTQRPRGFGFITYDSEDAVERALFKTFHSLNGKMVEVKRAVPKESSPGPSRSPFSGSNFGMSRVSSLLSFGAQAYSPSLAGGYGFRMDDRPNPVSVARTAFPPFGTYGTSLNPEARVNGEIRNFISRFSHDWGSNASYRRSSFGDYRVVGEDNGLTSNSMDWSLWGKGGTSNAAAYSQDSSSLLGFKTGNISACSFNGPDAIQGSFGRAMEQTSGIDPSYTYGDLGYVHGGVNLSSRGEGNGKNGNDIPIEQSYAAFNSDQEGNFDGLYGNNDDIAWGSSSSEFKGSDPFEFGFGNASSDLRLKNPALCW